MEISVSDALGRTLTEAFRATIVPSAGDLPTSVTLETEATLMVAVRQTVPDAVVVRASRANGMPAPEVGVLFTSAQDVAFNPVTAVTSPSGGATTSITFGCFVGAGAIRATLMAPGMPSAALGFVTSPGPPSQMFRRQGDGQSGNPGLRLDGPGQALRVQLVDACGNGIPGQRVVWNVSPAGAGTLENVFDTTDFSGQSSVLVRLGSRAGAFTVTAASGSLSVTFNLSVNVIPTRLAVASGNNQMVVLGQLSPQPLVVEIQDANGIGAPGVEVVFSVTSGSGSLTPPRVQTDAQGRASTRLQAGSDLGPITVVATAIGRSITFTFSTVGRVPMAAATGFVNGANFRPGWVPGGLGTIFGPALMDGVSGVVTADRAPFPTTLRGIRVVVEGVDAPVISLASRAGQDQINLQVPFGLSAPGTATVVIHNNGSSATFTGVRILAVEPAIFEVDVEGGRFAAALHPDFSLITPANPTGPGRVVLLFLTGLGSLARPVGTNEAGPTPAVETVVRPVVGINDEGVEVLGSFYAPGLYTVNQINFVIPLNAAPGIAKLSVVAGGARQDDSRIAIGSR